MDYPLSLLSGKRIGPKRSPLVFVVCRYNYNFGPAKTKVAGPFYYIYKLKLRDNTIQ